MIEYPIVSSQAVLRHFKPEAVGNFLASLGDMPQDGTTRLWIEHQMALVALEERGAVLHDACICLIDGLIKN